MTDRQGLPILVGIGLLVSDTLVVICSANSSFCQQHPSAVSVRECGGAAFAKITSNQHYLFLLRGPVALDNARICPDSSQKSARVHPEFIGNGSWRQSVKNIWQSIARIVSLIYPGCA